MKTTKNYFNYLFIALTLVFSISLSSCSDDDENVGSKNDLIGTWQCIHSEGYEKETNIRKIMISGTKITKMDM